jgi:hypothetical protein
MREFQFFESIIEKIILAILTVPLTEIKIILTHLINHLVSYEY